MVVGNVTVTPGVTLELSGTVIGGVNLEPSSRAFLRGTVNGDVTNQGGGLEVWGSVKGRIYRNGGTTVVHPNAIVKGES
jgi:hypothetical protein